MLYKSHQGVTSFAKFFISEQPPPLFRLESSHFRGYPQTNRRDGKERTSIRLAERWMQGP
jgi:hypothetical protein